MKEILEHLNKLLSQARNAPVSTAFTLIAITGAATVARFSFSWTATFPYMLDFVPAGQYGLRQAIAWVVFVFGFAAVAILRRLGSGTVFELIDRTSYADTVIAQLASARTSALVCAHTLEPSSASKRVARMQQLLANAVRQNKDVRLLAPCGSGRLPAALELSDKGIPARYLYFLEDADLRFALIDNELCVVSLKDDPATGKTSRAAIVRSARLGFLLRRYFDENWTRPEALDFRGLLQREVALLRAPEMPLSPSLMAQRLHLPEHLLIDTERALTQQTRQRLTAFVIGRPGSGKSTVCAELEAMARSRAIPVNRLDDYGILHAWSRSDSKAGAFEQTAFNGFRVKNLTVLDDVLRELQTRLAYGDATSLQIVEFARRDYLHALAQFDPSILAACRIIYVSAPLEVCIERNRARSGVGAEYSGVVPDDVLQGYYSDDDLDELAVTYRTQLVTVNNDSGGRSALTARLREVFEHLTPTALTPSEKRAR